MCTLENTNTSWDIQYWYATKNHRITSIYLCIFSPRTAYGSWRLKILDIMLVLGTLGLAYTIAILLASFVNTSFQCQLGNAMTETGHALVGVSYESFKAVNYSECLTECVRSTVCKSFNFVMTNGSCDLNSETKYTRQDLYARRENSIYTTKTANHRGKTIVS